MRVIHTLSLALALLAGTSLAQPVPLQNVPDARAGLSFPDIVPQPLKAQFPQGVLPVGGLGLKLVGSDPELAWAARDLREEFQTRLGVKLPDGGSTPITIGTRADAGLAALAQKAGLLTDQPEGYALWVDGTGAYVVGADAAGAYHGAQTLRQLLTAGGLRFAQVQDAPKIARRIAMIYLDAQSQPVNDRLIPLLAELKYNAVLVMSDYVQWDTAKKLGFAHPGGASKAEATRVAQLAREHGLEPIPLIETLGHVGWMFYGGANRDLWQDPQSPDPFAYDTLNPRTYSDVVLPVLTEAVQTFGAKTVHIGHDEVRNKDRFPARENGKALGFEKLFVDDVVKLHDHLKSLSANTMLWHDVAFADAFKDQIPAALPKDIQIAYWNYAPADDYPLLKDIQAAGFQALGASWADPMNPESFARSAAKYGAGMIQTRWNGYFGNPSIWDGQANQGVAYIRAGNAFWNPDAPPLAQSEARYRDLYQPTPYASTPGALVDLSGLVTRSLADTDGQGWIHKGADIDLSAFPTGDVRLGAYRFRVSGAVMLKGSRPAASDLPERATVDLNRKAAGLAFLHTTGWPAALDRDRVGRYEIRYADGQTLSVPLDYGRHIRAWTDTVPASMVQAPAWSGKTRDGLDVAVSVLEWTNPRPDVPIQSVTLVSEGKNANPTLLGLTVLGSP